MTRHPLPCPRRPPAFRLQLSFSPRPPHPAHCGVPSASSLFLSDPPAATLSQVSGGECTAAELGVRFRSSQPGFVTAIRFWKAGMDSADYEGRLYSRSGALLGSTGPASLVGAGWSELPFAAPVRIEAGFIYVAAYYSASGNYAYTLGGRDGSLSVAADSPPLRAAPAGEDGPNGILFSGRGGGFPRTAPAVPGTNFWADVVFVAETDQSAPRSPPSVAATVPRPNAAAVAVAR